MLFLRAREAPPKQLSIRADVSEISLALNYGHTILIRKEKHSWCLTMIETTWKACFVFRRAIVRDILELGSHSLSTWNGSQPIYNHVTICSILQSFCSKNFDHDWLNLRFSRKSKVSKTVYPIYCHSRLPPWSYPPLPQTLVAGIGC